MSILSKHIPKAVRDLKKRQKQPYVVLGLMDWVSLKSKPYMSPFHKIHLEITYGFLHCIFRKLLNSDFSVANNMYLHVTDQNRPVVSVIENISLFNTVKPSFMKMLKIKGPKIEPWGTPLLVSFQPRFISPI